MLSFRFDLTSAQVRVLMDVYAGSWEPGQPITDLVKHTKESPTLQDTAKSHFVTIVQRLIDKGLVIHIDRKSPVLGGYHCTDKGKTIARMIADDAGKILAQLKLAEKRGVA